MASNIIAQYLSDTHAYADKEVPVLVTSGLSLTPFFLNAEKLCRDANISAFLSQHENDPAGIIEHATALMGAHKEFSDVIEFLMEKTVELGYEDPFTISGGMRGDLIFSGPLAAALHVDHCSLYKQKMAQSPEEDRLEILTNQGMLSTDVTDRYLYRRSVLHVVDLLTVGSSVYNVDTETNRKIGWASMLRDKRATITDILAVVDRNQGAQERLGNIGITTHPAVLIDEAFLSAHSRQPAVVLEYLEDERKWTEKYLKANGVDILVPYFKPGTSSLERGKKFLGIYAGFLDENGLLWKLDQAIMKEYKRPTEEIIRS